MTQTGGREQKRALAKRPVQSREDERERRGKEREVGDQHRRRKDRERRRQPAERRHRLDEPVERAGEIDRAGQQAKQERASGRGSRRADDGDDERRQRQPGARWMAEFREAEREQRAREERLARNPGLELFFLLDAQRHLFGLAAIVVAADVHLVERWPGTCRRG